jgi:diguanylate cyclase (GGDEF)-like protein
MRIVSFFNKPSVVWGVALAGIVLIAAVDYGSGVEVRTFPLYYGPISLLAWDRGRRAATVAAVLCAAAWLASNLFAGLQYSTAGIWMINTAVQGASFATVGLLIAVLRDRTIRERTLSRIDPLTRLLNSRAFYEDANRLLSLSQRKGYPLTMAYIDLDHFKEVNDRFGHRAGDEVLRTVGRLLSQSVRPSDLRARLGGDEFALLLLDADSHDAAAMLERLRALLANALASGPVPVTGSIGAVTFVTAPSDVERMVHDADAAMYAAKAIGGNQVHLTVAARPLAGDAIS